MKFHPFPFHPFLKKNMLGTGGMNSIFVHPPCLFTCSENERERVGMSGNE